MTTPTIRAALERLVEALDEYDPKWDAFPDDALTAARAALDAAQPEEPSDADLHRTAFSYSQPCFEFDYIGFAHSVLSRWGRPAALLEQLAAAAPAVVPVAVSKALIKAECVLADVAEGERWCDEGDLLQWAERRCAKALANIRPVMKQHQIRTSEWPPLPAPQGGEGEG